jgi:hypothetical protein
MIREQTFTGELGGTMPGCEDIAALWVRAGSATRERDLATVRRGSAFWWLPEGTAG